MNNIVTYDNLIHGDGVFDLEILILASLIREIQLIFNIRQIIQTITSNDMILVILQIYLKSNT